MVTGLPFRVGPGSVLLWVMNGRGAICGVHFRYHVPLSPLYLPTSRHSLFSKTSCQALFHALPCAVASLSELPPT
jgi:hypothetical protein